MELPKIGYEGVCQCSGYDLQAFWPGTVHNYQGFQ